LNVDTRARLLAFQLRRKKTKIGRHVNIIMVNDSLYQTVSREGVGLRVPGQEARAERVGNTPAQASLKMTVTLWRHSVGLSGRARRRSRLVG
jgi:hypothetical protein